MSTTIVVPRKLRSRCKVKKHWYEAKEILERDPDPLPGSGPPAQTVQALLGGGPLGPGLGSSAESTPRVDQKILRQKVTFAPKPRAW